eukprot:1157517-Pelagomonas_calceolata.AAC.3
MHHYAAGLIAAAGIVGSFPGTYMYTSTRPVPGSMVSERSSVPEKGSVFRHQHLEHLEPTSGIQVLVSEAAFAPRRHMCPATRMSIIQVTHVLLCGRVYVVPALSIAI